MWRRDFFLPASAADQTASMRFSSITVSHPQMFLVLGNTTRPVLEDILDVTGH